MRLLAVNCLLEEGLARDFNGALERIVKDAALDLDYTSVSPPDLADLNPRAEKYTHLVVSGSEASALEDNPWDHDLARLIASFAEDGRCVLGICYGHQFIVRTLAGREYVRQRNRRVWGWLPLEFAANELFRDISRSVCLTVNGDEVFDLPPKFKILASLDHCRVMAYQYATARSGGFSSTPNTTSPRGTG